MTAAYDHIAENYKQICFDIEEAKVKYRAQEDKVEIMAVTKTVPPEAVNFAVGCGVRLLGENRVQEYLSKREAYAKDAQVHFIGHMQTNKVKYLVGSVALIQSVDSLRLAQEIDRLAERNDLIQDILIEVNIGGEESKSGVLPQGLLPLLEEISLLKKLRVQGLMTIPPLGNSEKYFYKMNELFVDIQGKNIDNINMSVLSMGMSADYALAVKYGSNLVRIGTKLFGTRK